MTISAVRSIAGRGGGLAKAVAALTLTQMIGWSTTFHIPAVLADPMAADLGLPRWLVFGGLTLMLIVAAVISPLAGRLLDRDGVRRWMVTGSCLMTLGLTILASAGGPLTFGLTWIAFGIAMPLALNQGASTALVQIAPDRARRGIALLLLLTGLSATIAWPTLIALESALGWRGAVFVCAGIQLAVCMPLHWLCLPRGRVLSAARTVGPARERAVPVAPARGIFMLAAVGFSLGGMLTWGLPLHMIGILEDFGHERVAAVSLGSLMGPGQVFARAFEMAGGHRLGILTLGIGAAALMPLALVSLLLWGTSAAGAIAFAMLYGLSAGLISIVRAVAPLRLFGTAAYAQVLGRLGLPQNIAFGVAPLGFAVLREHVGSVVLVWVSLALALVALGAMIELSRRAPAAVPD